MNDVESAPLRTRAKAVVYPCRDELCRIRPVPRGKTRAEVYCPTCEADECLIRTEKPEKPRGMTRTEAQQHRVRTLRAQGLDQKRRPLKTCCWNCAHLRAWGTQFVCGWLHGGDEENLAGYARSARTMRRWRFGEQRECGGMGFELRRVDGVDVVDTVGETE